jgi:predicted membrane protein
VIDSRAQTLELIQKVQRNCSTDEEKFSASPSLGFGVMIKLISNLEQKNENEFKEIKENHRKDFSKILIIFCSFSLILFLILICLIFYTMKKSQKTKKREEQEVNSPQRMRYGANNQTPTYWVPQCADSHIYESVDE